MQTIEEVLKPIIEWAKAEAAYDEGEIFFEDQLSKDPPKDPRYKRGTYKEPETYFKLWLDDGKFWLMYNDCKRVFFTDDVYTSENEKKRDDISNNVANALEEALIAFNWSYLKSKKPDNNKTPTTHPMNLAIIGKNGHKWVHEYVKNAVNLKNTKHDVDKEKYKKEIRRLKSNISGNLEHYLLNDYYTARL